MSDLIGKYYFKESEGGEWRDISTFIEGVHVLKIDGFLSLGAPTNVYTAQWVDSQTEDYMIASVDDNGLPYIVRKNVDIEITFIVGEKYAKTSQIDVRSRHDTFVGHLTNGEVWIKSPYVGKEVRCVCLEEYAPTTIKLQRNGNSYIIGTIKLHTLESPKVY